MSRHAHILGICGTFMGGVAALAQATGWRVTGCDANVYPPMSEQLRALGIELMEGYSADQLNLRPDLWVVGNVVSRGNALMEAILDARQPYVSGPQWLAEHLLALKRVIAVAGTHGKTTTAAMTAWILEAAGAKPAFLIGGIPENFGCSARLGGSEWFVIEADEYDTAFFDKRSKFVHYRPTVAILNNLEFDHADIFVDLADIERQFHYFVRTIPRSGRIVVNGRDPALARVLAKGCWTPLERFGVPDGWEVGPVAAGGAFEVRFAGRSLGTARLAIPGEHNRLNAVAAIAAARQAGVEPPAAIAALGSFAGVRRRMQLRGSADGVAVYDDFAHHPTAIRATIEGLRQRAGTARILAVLEPRSNTMKLGVMKDQLPSSLGEADRVFVYGAGLGWDAASTFAPLGARARCFDDLARLTEAVVEEAHPGDQILVMSNGDFGGIHARVLERLARRSR